MLNDIQLDWIWVDAIKDKESIGHVKTMNLYFDKNLANEYSSKAQIARVLTENWVLNNSYCPKCGNLPLSEFENNRPVADFTVKIASKNLS